MGNDIAARLQWLAIAILVAAFIGTAAGVIRWLGDHDLGGALLFGAGAFAGALLLILTVIRFLGGRDE
ncbi:hypothetical protein K7640_02555 [Micromonospora sp. PLK6-60]|uniref:hypothetical protein n=1 Tax=Micromonospora sp. PLK6-60 TaxID=2873383 RepID=UPI001CA61169|nr:hypothetical protein [Micromonospora sp. PLK6-60]MBY8870722.1 hypothetical protein [Micromonospora sp. PLK6-60]